jgi:phospholipase/carboxylesterase
VPTRIDPFDINFNGWFLRIKKPANIVSIDRQRIMLLLHGWTGDENSMWFFTRNLPDHYCLISPRGIFESPQGGYSWRIIQPGRPIGIEEFQYAIEQLITLIEEWEKANSLPHKPLDLMGFSQGAALSLSFLLTHPDRVRTVAALSGFLPDSTPALLHPHRLDKKQIFIAHGTEDDVIPVERARIAAELLGAAGAEVTYCEDAIGHKVSAPCLSALENFYKIL